MSAVDEDTELRDLLVQTLDKNGVLGKIKAELRANIFLALEEQDKIKNPTPFKNKPLSRILETTEGVLCVSVINQFLKKYNLDYTSAVFRPEANLQEDSLFSEDILQQRLHVDEARETVLSSMVHSRLSQPQFKPPTYPSDATLSPKQLEFLRTKFESFSHEGTALVDRKDVSAVLSLACPRFSPSMLETFVNEELKNKLSTSSVNFQEFTKMFSKLHEMCNSLLSVGTWDANTSIPLHETNVKSPETLNSFTGTQDFRSSLQMKSENESNPQAMEIATTFQGNLDDDFFADQRSQEKEDNQSDDLKPHSESKEENLYSEKSDLTNENWSENRRKVAKLDYSNEYNEDFHSESNASISEDIPDDISGISSEKDSNLDLTDDQTVSEAPKADYMESVNLNYK